MKARSNRPSGAGRGAAGREHFEVVEGDGDRPAARFVTSDSPSTSAPRCTAAIVSSTVDMPTRSAPSVQQHPDLGRRLVRAAEERGVHALGQRRVDDRGRSARRRGEYAVDQVDEPASGTRAAAGDRRAATCPVRLRWSAMQHRAADGPVGAQAAGGVRQHDDPAARSTAVRTPCTTVEAGWPSYKWVRPASTSTACAADVDGRDRARVPGDRGAGNPCTPVIGTVAAGAPSSATARPQPEPSTMATSWRSPSGGLGDRRRPLGRESNGSSAIATIVAERRTGPSDATQRANRSAERAPRAGLDGVRGAAAEEIA